MISFKSFFIENNIGDRVGIQHLYSDYKPTEYSMSFENLETLIDSLKMSRGLIQPGNSQLSEKADGMAVKFGLDPNFNFFLQSSYSGPVFDGNFDGKIKHPPTKVAFEEEFPKLKKLISPVLKRIAKQHKLKGIRVNCEWLYSPFAIHRENKPGFVYFVATNYSLDKIGKWSTFPIINATDFQGNPIDDSIFTEIVHSLSSLSNDDIKFVDLNVVEFPVIDLRAETIEAEKVINSFKLNNPDYEEVLYSGSRKREDHVKKKQMRQSLINSLLHIQKAMHVKIQEVITNIEGKLGEYEGMVFKLQTPSGKPFLFKVISPSFHEQKGRTI
jgi:hypothetical protein